MRFRPLIAGAAALALALSLTACSDDGDDESTDTDTTEAADTSEDTETTEAEGETTEPESETTEAESETTEAEGEETDLDALLLTAADVGDTFVEGPYETSEEPGPCGTSLDADYPYDAIAGTVIGDEAQGLFLQHEVRTYADAATAGETYTAAAEEAFACGAETEQPGLTLGEVTDLTETIGGDASSAVEFVDEENQQEGVVVFVQIGSAISVYQFVGPTGVEGGPDPVALVTGNIEVIEAALG